MEEQDEIFPYLQRYGIVRWDFGREKPRGPRKTINKWTDEFRKKSHFLPYVIARGTYSKHGLEKKLELTGHLISYLESKNALRRDSLKSRTTQRVYEQLSIAQTISAIFRIPVENILIEDTLYNSQNNKNSEEYFIKILWNAYKGETWFENFKRMEQEKISSKEVVLPLIREWQIIPRASLRRILKVSQKTIKELNNAGFLIPKDGKPFVSKGIDNFVHTKALARFFALLEDRELNDKYLPKDRDDNYQDILQSIINNRFIPYFNGQNILPEQQYSLDKINEKTGIAELKLRSWIFNNKGLPFSRIKYTQNRTRVSVSGIDLAIYNLRGERKKQMNVEDISLLFGIQNSQVKYLHLPPVSNGLYGSQQYVYPIYDVFCEDVKKKLVKNS